MHCHAGCIALALEVVIQLMCSQAEPKHLVMHQYGQRDSNLQVMFLLRSQLQSFIMNYNCCHRQEDWQQSPAELSPISLHIYLYYLTNSRSSKF